MRSLEVALARSLNKFGLQVSRLASAKRLLPVEVTDADREIVAQVEPYTMTSWGRIWALLEAVRYVQETSVEGAFVECGVWRGGSVMAMAYKLLQAGEGTRDLWLYDTFSGMTSPTEEDIDETTGTLASKALSETEVGNGDNIWCVAGLADVKANIASTGYPTDRVTYVEGDVAQTLLEKAPGQIAILRLDTDWYASTKTELEILYPRLAKGGVCILDDYGHWQGARKAVDEYFAMNPPRPLIMPVDFSGRIFIKDT